MKEFLRRLKLIDCMTTTLQTSKAEFAARLSEITDENSTGIFSDTLDAFSSSKNEFKGYVSSDNFKIKRKRRFFDTNMNFAVANGTLTENNGELTIHTEITVYNNFLVAFFGFILVVYSTVIIAFLSVGNADSFFVIPFIVLHATLMFTIPYFIMRRSVKRLKYELEREFFYLTKPK